METGGELLLKVELQAKLLQVGFQVQNNTGHHTIILDESKMSGGTDLGPSPIQMFLASLASGLAITAEFIARKKEIKIYELKIYVEGECLLPTESLPNETSGFKEITYEIQLSSNLSSKERSQFIKEVVRKCPITNTLAAPIKLKSFNEKKSA